MVRSAARVTLAMALCAGVLAIGSAPAGAQTPVQVVCESAVYHPGTQTVYFTIVFDRAPDFTTTDAAGRIADQFQYYLPSVLSAETIIRQHEVRADPTLLRTKAGLLGSVLRTPGVRREEKLSREKARETLAYVGLRPESFDQISVNLSYGDQRRLEIARALASDPKLLLLDEPTAGMNPNESARLTEFMERLRDELDLTILLIEHDMKVVMGVSEHITVLDHGEKIAEGLPKEIRENERVVEAYLGKQSEN